MAKVRRVSKRIANELTHCTAQELAAICGVSTSAIYGWKQVATFPPLSKQGKYCIRDCCWWYQNNRAAKEHQLDAVETLTRNLGIKPAVSDDGSAEPIGQTQKDRIKEMKEFVELRRTQAQFEREFGGVVRPRHVSELLMEEFTKLRSELELIEKDTGFPMRASIQRMVDRLASRLQQMESGGVDADDE